MALALQDDNMADHDANIDVDELVDRYAHLVYRLAFARCGNRDDADDVFQQVFLRYISKRPRFNSPEHERAWFIRVTVNCAKSLWNSAFRRRTQPLAENIAAKDGPPDRLSEYLAKLPRDHRVLIHLFYYEGISTAEIARLMNKREGTIRMQLTRARRLLKEIMEGDEDIEI